MSRFRKEWDRIPMAAHVVAALVYLGFLTLMAGIFVFPALAEGKVTFAPLVLFVVTGALGLLMWAYVVLIGYIWADATRRRMNALLWVLLAIFIPNAIGVILYFILRDPVPVPCPSCGIPAGKDDAFCPSCGATVRPACPQCRHPVETGWTHCGRCGAALATESSA